MHISRVQIRNLRNFGSADAAISSNAVILGENRVGKSNFLFAIRLVLDPSLPDSARQLKFSDLWDGLSPAEREAGPTVEVHVDFREFDGNAPLTALLTDYRLAADHTTARLSFVYRKKDGITVTPTEADYEFKVYGGGDETRPVSLEVRRRICLDVLPALRDAESDLGTWRTSPLRPLLDDAISHVAPADLDNVSQIINSATTALTELEPIQLLETSLRQQMAALAGDRHDVKAKFGFAPTDPVRLFRTIRVLIDDGARSMSEASLGSANLALLTLKLAEFEWRRAKNERNFTLLAVEEPEAHLHPHLQRKVFRSLFNDQQQTDQPTRSLILTTHSPSIASVAPIRSIVIIRHDSANGSKAYSLAALPVQHDELEDLQRYMDTTRADMLFARAVIFVEGDAEAQLIPVFAASLGLDLDELGISVCSVGGTNFSPFVKLAAALRLPFSVITDWDPRTAPQIADGWARTLSLINDIRAARGMMPLTPAEVTNITTNETALRTAAEQHKIFLNTSTLETEIAADAALRTPLLDVLSQQGFGAVLTARLQSWLAGTTPVDNHQLMLMIGYVSKGRFAQQLSQALVGQTPPAYITSAINRSTVDIP